MGIELKAIHILGPVLATVAVYLMGKNLVDKEKGRGIKPVPVVVLFLSAILFHFIFGDGTFLDRISVLLLDFGIGMLIGTGYLRFNKVNAKVFLGLGLVSMLVAGSIYLATHVIGWVWNGLKNGFSQPIAGQLLMELGPDDTIEELNPLLIKYDAKWEKAFPEVDLSEDEDLAQYFLVTVDEDVVRDFMNEAARDRENVDFIEQNYRVGLIAPVTGHSEKQTGAAYMANDPQIANQWWMDPNTVNEIHFLLKNATPQRKAKVAIVDTGLEEGHEDIGSVFHDSPGKGDPHGHGTHCAGLAGAATNNGVGMASLNWEGKFIEIYSFHALGKDGYGTIESVVEAIISAAESDVDVISMSLGGPHQTPPKAEVDAIEYAVSRGCIVIVAAGNNNSDARFYSPANIPGVIVVGALDHSLNKAGFSNTTNGLNMPISAPGVDILSLEPNNGYGTKSGTSMATPIVSGLVGVLRALNPNLSASEVYAILKSTGKTIEDQRKVGRAIDAEAAIKKVLQK